MSAHSFAPGNSYLRQESAPLLPPPKDRTSLLERIRRGFFSSLSSSLLTLAAGALILWLLPDLLRFTLIDAVWSAPDGAACRAPDAGACWAFVAQKLPYFTFGSYPVAERWRVVTVLLLGFVLIAWLLWPIRKGAHTDKRVAALLFFLLYPLIALILLRGTPWLGLPLVDTDLWGGIFLSLVVAGVGIVVSLPLGIFLALGRRSTLPVVSLASTLFIEFVRGVPMITVLFMANFMLPLFLPASMSVDRLIRPLIGVALFASAYMAEVVRGGLQAVPKGQFEGAAALGLPPWKTLQLVVLPQALAHVIPGIVNTFIGLFKDTTLVAAVGIFDFLRTVDSARLDPAWAGPTISASGYLFAALFYFVFCFGMSRYSIGVERRLARGQAR
ncbi:amino acid ABC transporter permease [Beijerinckia indica]|uniref:Polar amino acid ABC transporter, inner membrane subunit n=1 Tax=Beijerinckia indica subsp. indica (strain ATCC 9039 / DSM 1715 / NCIMB 8712) TaxID=395963 RepID=B2IBX4_BEII9|nr:amino acid ABC transporter permease [Beijerinckia indica]ACB95232.1 polar amino acid ABC transporter, inner membrane subunit [Beijerinckia indica subsp. indica ATCC 9039]